MSVRYEEICSVHCTENGQSVIADILDFKPQVILVVSLNKSIKLTLRYVPRHENYQGSMYGREFTTKGPKGTYVSNGR
jgi:hypothetical protein